MMQTKIKKLSTLTRTIVVLVIIAAFVSQALTRANRVDAITIDELQKKSQQLQANIQSNNDRIAELGQQADSLQVKVDELNNEIARASSEIELTEVKLEELRQRLKLAEEELEHQKQLLKATLQAIYERSGASTFEMLMATDNLTSFLNEQEYLGQLQSAVKQSTEEIIALKQQIESEKKEQEDLLTKQKQQRAVVAAKKAEQQAILDQTQGEESKYREIVSAQMAELEKAEAELAALLAAGSYVSYGPVARGQVIGAVGSTGYSTGPHIHFQVYHNGSTVNPSAGGSTIINGYGWPLFSGAGYISQAYGCVAAPWYYATQCNGGSGSFHNGLDIATSAYTPIVAVESGEVIFKGCRSGLGYVVVIDHGGGWQTWYPHQVTPDGQVYGYC